MPSPPSRIVTCTAIVLVVASCVFAAPARAEVTVWEQDGSYLDLSMLIQMQARFVEANGAGTTPDGVVVFFRRLRPAVSGSIDRNWRGIIEMDFSAGFEGQDLKTSVEDAYLEYMGFEDNQQNAVKIGSIYPAFGREFLTSSTKLLTVENTFNGIHWYGTPDLTMGAGLTRVTPCRTLSTQIVLGMMSINQRPDRIWFQSPQNQTSNTDDTGFLVTGRVDFWPLGEMPLEPKRPSQLAFDPSDLAHTEGVHLLLGLAGYGWWNNNDNNQPTMQCPTMNNNVCPNGVADVRHVYGGEVSASVMGYGFTLDAEYHRIRGMLRDSTFDGGLYQTGVTNLNVLTVNGGYMIVADTVEGVGSFSLLTATNFPSNWYSSRLAVNWFVHEHGIQLSAEATRNTNAFGTTDAHEDVGRVQAQLAW